MPASANLVHEISTSTGTGNFTLAAQNGKQRFSTAFGTGVTADVFDYFISNQDAAEWERGTGHMSDANTLVRDTVIESTNANAAVNFSAGTKNATNDVPAAKQVQFDANQNVSFNNYFANAASTVSAAGTTVLTAASARSQRLTGSATQTFQLPNATTLALGPIFTFDNNSSGALTINNAGGVAQYTVPAGGYVTAIATDISSSNGIWDFHPSAPSTVNWGSGSTGLVMNTVLSTTPSVSAGASGATSPAFIPQRGSATTGYGGDSTHLYGIVGGVTAWTISGTGVASVGYMDLPEIAEPASPAANTARLRTIDDGAGVTTVGFKDGSGNIVPMSHVKRTETGAVTRATYIKTRDFLHAFDFGVTADGSTDDTTAMQRAIDAALSANIVLNLPSGSIKTSSALTISGAMKMVGGGHLDTVFYPTNTTANIFSIDSTLPVDLQDFGIDAQSITMTNGAGISVTATGDRNVESQFTGIRIIGTYYGIVFDRAAYWTMDRCFVDNCKNIGVTVRNVFDVDEGDSSISNCVLGYFLSSPTSDNILLFQASSGGLKLHGSKLIGGYHGYHLGLAAGAQTLGPIITGCSIENQTVASIFLGADNDATSLIARTVIAGNEIAPFGNGYGIQIGGSATSGWCRGVTIVGNNITVDLDGAAASSARGITAAFATDLTISGNTIKNDGATGTTVGIELGGGITRVSKGLNIINGFATAISDSSTSPQAETIKGAITALSTLDVTSTVSTLDLYRAQGGTPGFWLDETDGGVKGALTVLDGGNFQVQRRATAFGAFEATLLQLGLTNGDMTISGFVKSSSATLGVGYGAGAGGTVTQLTNKSTGVTLNKVCGQITMNNAALAAAAEVSFTVTNSAVAATDTVVVNIATTATVDTYMISVTAVAAGSFRIGLTNVSGASQSEALVLNFAVIKAVAA